MKVKFFKPSDNIESVFNKDGLAIKEIYNLKNTNVTVVEYKDGSRKFFENYKFLIDRKGKKEIFNPTNFKSIEEINDEVNDNDLFFYENRFMKFNEILNLDTETTISSIISKIFNIIDDNIEENINENIIETSDENVSDFDFEIKFHGAII